MKKSILGIVLLLGLFSCGDRPPEESQLTPPNIVFVLTDDLGWADLSCYGNTFIETPNLDRMAARGIRFTDAYAAASLCSPSRAALISGQHPVTVDITEHIHGNQPAGPKKKLKTPFISQALGKEFMTLGELAKTAGYRTGYFGKWHLGGGEHAPQHRGFDKNVAGGYQGLPQSFFYPFFGKGSMPSIQDHAAEGDYLPDVLTTLALDYLQEVKDTNFFLFLSYYAPHVPIEAKDSLVQKYQNKTRTNPSDTLPNAHYAAMVEAIDFNVGRVLQKLEQLGLEEETLVVFSSDNGGLHVQEVPAFAKHTPPTTNFPLRAGKGYLYEGGIREPLILQWPEKVSPQVNATPVIHQDFFPTMARLIGAEEQDRGGLDWLNIPEIQRDSTRRLFWHVPHYTPQGGKPATAMRKGAFKLIEFYETGEYELYNLNRDLGETENLIDSETKIAESMKAELQQWKEASGAKLPEPNPNYEGE